MNIGVKIREFENTNQTVKDFNEVFATCQLSGYNDNDDVEIGGIAGVGKERVRLLTIGNEVVEHLFKPHFSREELLKHNINLNEKLKQGRNNKYYKGD